MSDNQFRCPRCGGSLFGAILGPKPDLEIMGYECHATIEGLPFQSILDFAAGAARRDNHPCGWHGSEVECLGDPRTAS